MLKAKDIMTTEVVAVSKDADIYRAIRMMVENNVTGLPVIDKDRMLVGVVTEKDVLKLLYEVEDRPGKVEDYMTRAVVAFDQETEIGTVADGLAASHFRRVPILNHGRLVGIISRKDVIQHIKEQWLTEKAPA
ncbi:MAG: CBS domain-containing protein [Sedimentisphaerales bacterium]|jgi:CBS domain-containing protein|nr:CBS domain-containing protein [Sedimentisphaerales bacterium]NLZ06768.1 CBS domain-containing protein [Phycisphaerae bacterium]HNY79260.1 CBS domain-containing protein [Sedimentisphaerales bacterium]HOC61548.1 CBS domain-containing protein [Sedimentisphaerales bacterium]HOH65188.1 CBS domain-containing protein [Sedimentisphaerales bacterium]